MVHRGKPNVRLSDCMICNSSTLQESEVLESGTYPVYGANGIVGYLDCYATLNEAETPASKGEKPNENQ